MTDPRAIELEELSTKRKLKGWIGRGLLAVASSLAALMLGWLVWRTAAIGLPYVDWGFLTSFPAREAARAGIKPALVGSIWLGLLTLGLSLPLGIGAAIYLNEYAEPTRLNRMIRTAIANLAGVPSVVFGLLGLVIFVRWFGWGQVLLAGACTLALLSLPMIVVSTEEALKAVPRSVRDAAFGLGATRWQVVKDHVLPAALPGILTGSILALARAIGETAPLIIVGGATAVFFLPDGPMSLYSALPLQTFYWAANPQPEFRDLAAAGTVVLLLLTLSFNLVAILLRNRFKDRSPW